jgi:hypothetical protein
MRMSVSLDPTATATAVKEWYEYWHRFRGKKVRIMLSSKIGSSTRFGMNPAQVVVWREILEGAIEAVQKYPAGFILKDAAQFMMYERNVANIGTKTWEREVTESNKRQQSSMKFVSFSAIRTIEFA